MSTKPLSTTGQKKLGTLINHIIKFKNIKPINYDLFKQFENKIRKYVLTASNQSLYARKLIDNIKTNEERAKTF